MKTIGCVEVDSILGVGIAESKSGFTIEFLCTDGVHVFAEYPTLEKAERYFCDLVMKIEHTRKSSNFLLT